MGLFLERVPSGGSFVDFLTKATIAIGSLVIIEKIRAPVDEDERGFKVRNGKLLTYKLGNGKSIVEVVPQGLSGDLKGVATFVAPNFGLQVVKNRGRSKKIGPGGHPVTPFVGKTRLTKISARTIDLPQVNIDLRTGEGTMTQFRVDGKATIGVEDSEPALKAAIFGNESLEERAGTMLIGAVGRAARSTAEPTPYHIEHDLPYDPSEILGDSDRMLGRVLTPDFADALLASTGAHLYALDIRVGARTDEEVRAQGPRDAASIAVAHLGLSGLMPVSGGNGNGNGNSSTILVPPHFGDS